MFAYVVMDGFDLGLGMLFPLFPEKHDRDVMMNTVAPVWDGNETWLVLGGGGLFAAFPLAYAVLMPALYTPLIVMLLGLVFRGVAFEFRWRTAARAQSAGTSPSPAARCWRRWRRASRSARSCRASMSRAGLWRRLVGLADAVQHADRRRVVVGYALLGATWLVMKTEGELRDRAYHLSWWLLFAMLGAIGAVSIATPLLDAEYAHRWFAWPNILFTAPVPIAVAGVTVLLLRGLANRQDYRPFFLSLVLFALSYAGLGISIWPYIVPRSMTIWQAAAPENSQIFMLVGVAVMIPIILVYTAWAYWVFRGKVNAETGYH